MDNIWIFSKNNPKISLENFQNYLTVSEKIGIIGVVIKLKLIILISLREGRRGRGGRNYEKRETKELKSYLIHKYFRREHHTQQQIKNITWIMFGVVIYGYKLSTKKHFQELFPNSSKHASGNCRDEKKRKRKRT